MTHLAKIPTFTIRQAVLADFDAMAPLWFQLDGYHQGKDPRRFPGTPQDAPVHCPISRNLFIAPTVHFWWLKAARALKGRADGLLV